MIYRKNKSLSEEELSKRGFGNCIGFGNAPALLVVDMMLAFTDSSLSFGMNQSPEIASINRVLGLFHRLSMPVYFTTTSYYEEDLSDAGWWYFKQKGLETLRAGTPITEIDSDIDRIDSDIIVNKKFASAFFGTDLVSRLNYAHRDTLIITGCTTSGCVRATAVDAIQNGYRPIVIRDAVADRLKQAHRQSLIDLELKYADVITVNQLVKYFGDAQ